MGSPSLSAVRLLATLLACLLLPGWMELVENVGHLLHDGHLAHSVQHDAQAAADHPLGSHDEAPCGATSHHCSCCRSVPASTLPDGVRAPGMLPTLDAEVVVAYDGRLVTRATPPPVPPPDA